jgi:hypothetical protein
MKPWILYAFMIVPAWWVWGVYSKLASAIRGSELSKLAVQLKGTAFSRVPHGFIAPEGRSSPRCAESLPLEAMPSVGKERVKNPIWASLMYG